MNEADIVVWVIIGAIVIAIVMCYIPALFPPTSKSNDFYFGDDPDVIEKPSSIKSTTTSGTKSSAKISAKSSVPSKPKEEKTPDTSQKTIYAYSPIELKHTCPFCDGENLAVSRVCEICRRDM